MTSTLIKNQKSDGTNQTGSSDSESQQLLTIKQFCFAFPWPSESAMRAYVFRSNELGISEAFFRVGRRVLIDSKKFFLLIKQMENSSPINQGGVHEKGTSQKREAR